jgi:translation initiation factor 2 subunit 2
MKRTDEHVTSFLFAELGTSGSVDGSRRLVIKGRFQQKQIENVLRRYIGKSFCLLHATNRVDTDDGPLQSST